ncbi:MAG: FAD-dependent oxidoreductase, partial [Lysobacterales bacterium]
MRKNKYDVAIVGGGLAGLSLAIQLAQRVPTLSTVVIESNPHPVPAAAHKVGESLVELATYYFSEVLGLRKHLDDEQLPKLGLRFFFHTDEEKAASDRILEECVELGAGQFPPSPSYQIDRGLFENYLAKKCQELGVTFLDNVKARGIEISSSDKPHLVEVEHRATGAHETIEAKWIVDACSRASILKRKLGLKMQSAHKVSAAWFRIA